MTERLPVRTVSYMPELWTGEVRAIVAKNSVVARLMAEDARRWELAHPWRARWRRLTRRPRRLWQRVVHAVEGAVDGWRWG